MRQMFTTVIIAFSMLWMGRNSWGPWKLRPPAKMLGQRSPRKESWAPSVPPRMARIVGGVPVWAMAWRASLSLRLQTFPAVNCIFHRRIYFPTQNLLSHAPTAIHVISAFYSFNRYKTNFRKSFRK